MNIQSEEINISQSTTGITPTWLGRHFQLRGDPDSYIVLGLIGQPRKVLLQSLSSDAMKKITVAEFETLAIRIDEKK